MLRMFLENCVSPYRAEACVYRRRDALGPLRRKPWWTEYEAYPQEFHAQGVGSLPFRAKVMAKRKSSSTSKKKSHVRFRTGNRQEDYVEFDAAGDEDHPNTDMLSVDEADDEEVEIDDIFVGPKADEEEDDEEEDDDDEDSEDEAEELEEEDGYDEESKLLRWGRSKAQLYGGDTADLEIGQDVEDAEEEEALALELQRQQYETLEASDFALDGDFGGEVPEAPSGLFSDKGDTIAPDRTTLRPLVEKLEISAGELMTRIRPALRAMASANASLAQFKDDALRAARIWCLATEQLLLCQCTNLGFAILLALEGINPASHPVAVRLVSLKRRIEALRPSAEKARPVIEAALGHQEQPVLAKTRKRKMPVPRAEPVEEDEADEEDDDELALEALPSIADDSGTLDAPPFLTNGEILSRRAFDDRDVEEDSALAPKNSDDASVQADDAELEFLRAYEASAKAAKSRKVAKAKIYEVQPRYGSWLDSAQKPLALEDGRRAASREIVQNRGLAPRKPKNNRNPRVKKRDKFRRAIIRRKGQVRDTVNVNTDRFNYGGEATGIRAQISRSRRVVA